jgi:hypothetical protein
MRPSGDRGRAFLNGSCDLMTDDAWIGNERIFTTEAVEVCSAQPYHLHLQEQFSRKFLRLKNLDYACLSNSYKGYSLHPSTSACWHVAANEYLFSFTE